MGELYVTNDFFEYSPKWRKTKQEIIKRKILNSNKEIDKNGKLSEIINNIDFTSLFSESHVKKMKTEFIRHACDNLQRYYDIIDSYKLHEPDVQSLIKKFIMKKFK